MRRLLHLHVKDLHRSGAGVAGRSVIGKVSAAVFLGIRGRKTITVVERTVKTRRITDGLGGKIQSRDLLVVQVVKRRCQLHNTHLHRNEECRAQAAGQRAMNRGPAQPAREQQQQRQQQQSSSHGNEQNICMEAATWPRDRLRHCRLKLLSKSRIHGRLWVFIY